jgi:hypothetical protein
LNTWICCGFLGGGMFTIACILFGYCSFPSLETIKLKIILKNTINAHLSGFWLMSYFMHFWKHNLSFYIWLSMSLYIVKSFNYIFIKLSKYFFNALVTTFYYVKGPFFIPNNITFHIKTPQYVTNVVLYLSFGFMEIWWYPKYPSKKNMPNTLLLCSTLHLWKVMGMDPCLCMHWIFWDLYKFSVCHFSW